MKKLLTGALVLAVAMVMTLGMTMAQEKAKPKHTIKDVMKEAHKKGGPELLAKVLDGKASADEKKQLVALYEDLGKNEPPKGDKKSWEEKTSALVKAAKAASTDDLKKASNCAACHKEHKG